MLDKNEKFWNEDGGMTLEAYEAVYDMILSLAEDADGINVFSNDQDEDIQKCKWIAAIHETLSDVPMSKAEIMFKRKKIKFDYCEFMNEVEYH